MLVSAVQDIEQGAPLKLGVGMGLNEDAWADTGAEPCTAGVTNWLDGEIADWLMLLVRLRPTCR